MKREGSNPIVVFISYVHESVDHQARVVALADMLRSQGVDARVDRYFQEVSPLWMARQIRDSDFVLVVCSPTYYRRAMGDELPGKGLGSRWESLLTFQQLYEAESDGQRKVVPIFIGEPNRSDVPEPLRMLTYYRVDNEEGFENLFRYLTDQPAISAPALGELKVLPSAQRPTLFSASQPSEHGPFRYFALSADERAAPFAVQYLQSRSLLNAGWISRLRGLSDNVEIVVPVEVLELFSDLLGKLVRILPRNEEQYTEVYASFLDAELIPVIGEAAQLRRTGRPRQVSAAAREMQKNGIPYIVMGFSASFAPLAEALLAAIYVGEIPDTSRVRDEFYFRTLEDGQSAISGMQQLIRKLLEEDDF